MSFVMFTCCFSRAYTAMEKANNMRLYSVHVQPLLYKLSMNVLSANIIVLTEGLYNSQERICSLEWEMRTTVDFPVLVPAKVLYHIAKENLMGSAMGKPIWILFGRVTGQSGRLD